MLDQDPNTGTLFKDFFKFQVLGPDPGVASITLHGEEQAASVCIPCRADAPERVRRLLILGVLALAPGGADAKPPAIQCPGENTVEMRYCAEVSWQQSTDRLQRKIPKALLQQWQEATRAVCAHAYRPFLQGTIYTQLVVGCDDHLNRALLKEFAPLNNQGDLERTP